MSWIERQRNVLDFALSSLLRRKGRNAALLLVYTGVVFLLASVMFLTSSLKREASLLLEGSPDMIVQRMQAGRHDLIPTAYLEKLRAIPGASGARGRLWGYYYDPLSRANFTLLVPDEAAPGRGSVFIGRGVSLARRAIRGDRISITAYDGTHLHVGVEGIFSPESELLSSDLILVSEDDFRRIFNFPSGFATDLVLAVKNPNERTTVAGKIRKLLPDTRVILKSEILRTYDAVFDWRGGLLAALLVACLLAFAILAWDKASGLSAEERREIGILKAVGWETSDVILLKFWEGAVVSLTSFFLGCILAFIHVFFASAPLLTPVMKGWSVLFPSFRIVPRVDLYQLATLFFLSVLPYTAATIVPSWRAATVDPDSVMRA